MPLVPLNSHSLTRGDAEYDCTGLLEAVILIAELASLHSNVHQSFSAPQWLAIKPYPANFPRNTARTSATPASHLLCAPRCGRLGVEEQDNGVLPFEGAQGDGAPIVGPAAMHPGFGIPCWWQLKKLSDHHTTIGS